MQNAIAKKLRTARSVVLSTHRHCDGDGLGAQLALFHGLRALPTEISGQRKEVRILNVDRPASKYSFLDTDRWIEVFGEQHKPLPNIDLALILDTNDGRLVEPLFTELKNKAREVLFIDHHPILNQGPAPTAGSFTNADAASTGELTYYLLKELGIELNAQIARALYTSIVFDTRLFRFVKSTASSHLIAAELLQFERAPEDVHQKLFSTYTVGKMRRLAQGLTQVEYFAEEKVAFIGLRFAQFSGKDFDPDDSGDLIDLIMDIGSVQVAALLREDGPGRFKISLRSKGGENGLPVLPLAETFGGGGHRFAAGAYRQDGDYDILRGELIREICALVGNGSTGQAVKGIRGAKGVKGGI